MSDDTTPLTPRSELETVVETLGSDTRVSLTTKQLAALISAAAKEGTNEGLAKVGLDHKYARDDIYELRDLLKMWRILKQQTVRVLVRTLMWGILGLLALGAYWKGGFTFFK